MSHYDEEREAEGWDGGVRCTRNMSFEQAQAVEAKEIIMESFAQISKNKYDKALRKEQSTIDVYDVLDSFGVVNPAVQHAIKKMLCTGTRGYKDYHQDLQEAIDSLERAKDFPPLPF